MTVLTLCFDRPEAVKYFATNLPSEAMWIAGKGIAEVYDSVLDFHRVSGGDSVDRQVFKAWIENETRIFDALGGRDGLDVLIDGLPQDTGERQDALASYVKYRHSKVEQKKLAAEIEAVTESKDSDAKEQLDELIDKMKELNVVTADPAKYIDNGNDIAGRATDMWELPDFISTQFRSLNEAMGYDADNSGFCKGAVHAVLAGSGKGKPLDVNTKVLMADGAYKRLGDIEVGERVINRRGKPDKVTAVHEQGVLPTVVMRTASGRKIRTALDHTFLTSTGWEEVSNIEVGDRLVLTGEANLDSHPTKDYAEFAKAGKNGTYIVEEWVSIGAHSQVAAFIGAAFQAAEGRVIAAVNATRPVIRAKFSVGSAPKIQSLLQRMGITSIVEDEELKVVDPWSAKLFIEKIPLRGRNKAMGEKWSARPDSPDRDVYHDEVVAIEEADPTECRCLTIENDHTFIANDLVVHNSTFAKSLMNHWVDKGHTVLFVNYEEAVAHWERVLFTQVTRQNVYKSKRMSASEKQRYTDVFQGKMEEWSDRFLVKHNPDTPYYEDLEEWIKALHRNGTQPDVIIIDTIQSLFLKRGGKLPRWGQYEEMMVRLEKLAKDTNAAIILTAQENSNRMKEKREVVQQSDAGGSLTIVQKCAITIFITDAQVSSTMEAIDDGIMQLQIPKNRITGKAFTMNPPLVRYNDDHKIYEDLSIPDEGMYDKTSLNANDFDFA